MVFRGARLSGRIRWRMLGSLLPLRRLTGALIPIAASADTALACRASYQAGQQRECSQTWPVGSVPKGSSGSWACSRSPHPRQRPAGERSGLRFSHSTTQQAKAWASASARGSPPSNSTMPARSSKKTCQSSRRPAVFGRPKQRHDLGLVPGERIEHGGRRCRGRVQHEVVAIECEFYTGGAGRLESLGRAHSRVLQPGAPVFSGADWGGGFASAPSAAVPRIGFQGVGADGRSRCHCRYRPHRGLPSARTEPRSHWPDWISAWARTMRTVRTVAAPGFSGVEKVWIVVMRMIRVRARPSRSKPISMPILRRKVAARRKPARQRPRAVRPSLGLGNALARHLGKGAQKVRGGSRPLRPRRHDGAHGGGDRVGVDHAFHRLVAVAAIGRPEGAGGPERRLAGRRPQREVRHARQLVEPGFAAARFRPFDHRVEQHAEDARALGLERGPQFLPRAGGVPRGSAPASGTRRGRRGRAA